MSSIAITGAGSFIGSCIDKWFSGKKSGYVIEEIDVQKDDWKTISFSKYDAIIHVAGIVHLQEKDGMWPLYHSVNCELTYEIAKKAKNDGVRHFVFMSTKGVYVPNTPHITPDTPLGPAKMYGRSKLEGEEKIKTLIDKGFNVSIVRAPTVYGEGCRGNFPRLISLSKKIHVFPKLSNQRSMLYIWNLCEFLFRLIDDPIEDVILYPQDEEYCGTLKMMEGLWNARGEKYYLSYLMAYGVKILLRLKKEGTLHTMFTDSVYDHQMSNYYNYEYCVFSFHEAMKRVVNEEG